ncbi:MAG: hypothetical protein CMJ58_02305 [Planctomycetaceae bacterium]|nr:hypothetical protein [Planctomycetaceae bacterium]
MELIVLALLLSGMPADDAASPATSTGVIRGVVLDGTHSGEALAGADVILRASVAGELVPVGQTQTDRYGRFSFVEVPLNPDIVYLPGANRDGVHYPGRRVRLDSDRRVADVQVVAYSAVDAPCPLVADRHEFDLTVDGQTLIVSETLEISNPTLATFVGRPMSGGAPVTLCLSIPPDFDRVTFDREFYGRRFHIVDRKPVTDMPWLPGKQELRFTYRVPLAETAGKYHRPLDIPAAEVRVRMSGPLAAQVACNLPLTVSSDSDRLEYASNDGRLLERFALDVQVGDLPNSWLRYGRWTALGILAALTTVTLIAYRR